MIAEDQKRMEYEKGLADGRKESWEEIEELKKEIELLRQEIEVLKARGVSGRKKHNEAWQASYQDFVIQYEAGKTIMEIVDMGQISRRTAYRYKAYYEENNLQ